MVAVGALWMWGSMPPFLGSVLLFVCLSMHVRSSLLILPPTHLVWGSLGGVHGTGPSPIPSPVFISLCIMGMVMPNKTVMRSSGVAVPRAWWGRHTGGHDEAGPWPLSAAAPARPGQRSARRRRHHRAQKGHPR